MINLQPDSNQMATRIDNYINKLSFNWEDSSYGSTLILPLFQVQIIQQKDKSYRILVGAYQYPKHVKRLDTAKNRAIGLIRELTNITELKLLGLYSERVDDQENELDNWKKLMFYDGDN